MSAESTLPRPDRRNFNWFATQTFLRAVFHGWNGYAARGTERLASGGGLLLINHQSYLDPLLVGLPLSRPVSYLARDTLFRVPVLGWFLRSVYVMPIDRQAAGTESIREAIRRMRHGFLVGIFPEGTRTVDGALGEFKPGFVALVRRAGVPVYPVGVAGAFDAFPRGATWLRPRPMRVVFGEAFSQDEVKGGTDALLTLARGRIADCVAEAEAWLAESGAGHKIPTPSGTAGPADTTE